MKKLYSIIVTLFLGFFVMQAQEMSVHSFALAETDLTAKQTKKIEVVEGKEASCSFELINIDSFNRIYDSDVMYSITINGTSYYMPFVDGGSFMMGSDDPEASSQDKPVHKVTISNYRIGKNLVSEGLWNAVMNPNDNPRIIYSKGDVSWNDCQEFIRRLNSLMGMNFQLPTEAQWEFAARMGIIDIEGSDSEWCSDWYGSYSSSSQTDPKGPSSGSQRVIRGGSAADDEGSSRVSCRLSASPGDRYRNVGFRLCLCL